MCKWACFKAGRRQAALVPRAPQLPAVARVSGRPAACCCEARTRSEPHHGPAGCRGQRARVLAQPGRHPLSRGKCPIRGITAGLLLACLAGFCPAVGAAEEGKPLFRFAQVNDAHVSYDNKDSYAGARERFEAVIARLSAPEHRPDLLLSVGDIANGDRREKLEPDNQEAAAVLRRFGVPVLPTPGNHEVLQGEGDAELRRAYVAAFGPELLTYAVFFRGILFVMVDDSGGWATGNPVAERRNAVVAEILARNPDVPKIIACHIPLVALREPETLAKSFGFSSWIARGDGGLLPIIEKHRDTVIAVLSGHLHLTGHVVVNGIHHISVSGTASYPSHYAEYVVFQDRIHVVMRKPPADLINPRSSIHSRTGVAYTDARHSTHEEYVAGRTDEQEFDISLPPGQRVRPTDTVLTLGARGWPVPQGLEPTKRMQP